MDDRVVVGFPDDAGLVHRVARADEPDRRAHHRASVHLAVSVPASHHRAVEGRAGACAFRSVLLPATAGG